MKRFYCVIVLIHCLFFATGQNIQTTQVDSLDSLSIKKRIHTIKQVEIYGRLSDANIKAGSIGLNIDINQIKRLPKFIGESDPYKALQYMGGVSQAGEANAGLYVRGGNNDQNLILLNGTQIQNPTHVLGMFSVFNPDLVGQMHFIKSAIPAEYGGRISSVVDINTINNIPEKTTIDGSIGLISSRICTHIPLTPKIMLYGSFRGSYLGTTIIPLLRLVGIDSTLTQNRYEFWDANAGIVFQSSKSDRISFHFYTGEDIIEINNLRKNLNFNGNYSNWGNIAFSLQYNHIFSENWSMNHQLNYSGFKINSQLSWLNSANELHSENTNFNYKADFSHYYLYHIIKFGTEIQFNKTQPNLIEIDSLIPIDNSDKENTFHTTGLAIYLRDELTINKWQINYGLRANLYMHLGPYINYNESANQTYPINKIIKTFYTIEPRIFCRYLLNDYSSIKISASRINQFMNQIPVVSIGLPADIVIPASLHINPQGSWHYSGGYFRNFFNNTLEISSELYYKTFENQLEIGSNPIKALTNNLLEKNLFLGKGWSYGNEITIKKNAAKFTGWLSYNLAWSYRCFDQVNNGKPYLAQNDRRHDLSIVLMYEFTKKFNVSALFVYATGNRVNLPVSWFIIDNKVIWEYSNYNSFEMPAYHRLDLSANYKLSNFHGIDSELNFSIYNIYNRTNPYQIWFGKGSTTNAYDYKLKMSYLLPIIPSVSWTFHF